jgi:S-adenosylmethionine hydrolase
MPRLTLLTDFGTADGYAAAMKGVIAGICPEARIDDAAHDLPAGDVEAAAWALAGYWRLYPPGTVHVVVVDPGVGGARRALALEADRRIVVAPDNGVVTRVLAGVTTWRAAAITERGYLHEPVSGTFHGRDVFAPAAAHLAQGVPLDRLGPPVTDPVRLAVPEWTPASDGVRGVVVHVDRFGNLITNIPEDRLGAGSVSIGERELGPVRHSYVDVRSGQPLALVGSAGMLEIAVRDGSAAATLGAGRGTTVLARRG